MGDSQNHDEVLINVGTTCGLISFLSEIVVLVFKKSEDSWTNKFVSIIAVCSMLTTVAHLMGEPDTRYTCTVSGVVGTFGGLSSFLWILFTTGILYSYTNVSCVQTWLTTRGEARHFPFRKMGVIIFIIALILAAMPALSNSYQQIEKTPWCWIKSGVVCFFSVIHALTLFY